MVGLKLQGHLGKVFHFFKHVEKVTVQNSLKQFIHALAICEPECPRLLFSSSDHVIFKYFQLLLRTQQSLMTGRVNNFVETNIAVLARLLLKALKWIELVHRCLRSWYFDSKD